MSTHSRFRFASAPDSWGVLDYPGPSWNQDYEQMLDEMLSAGYRGTELGPYGFFPTDPAILGPQLRKRDMVLLGSFVPVLLGDAASMQAVVDQIRKVGHLLSTLGAPFLVMADAQSPERDRIAGRVPGDGSGGFTAEQWKQVKKVVAEAASVTRDFDLDLVFHPHVSTYIETPEETERFFDLRIDVRLAYPLVEICHEHNRGNLLHQGPISCFHVVESGRYFIRVDRRTQSSRGSQRLLKQNLRKLF